MIQFLLFDLCVFEVLFLASAEVNSRPFVTDSFFLRFEHKAMTFPTNDMGKRRASVAGIQLRDRACKHELNSSCFTPRLSRAAALFKYK